MRVSFEVLSLLDFRVSVPVYISLVILTLFSIINLVYPE